jgi:hypothetical protein
MGIVRATDNGKTSDGRSIRSSTFVGDRKQAGIRRLTNDATFSQSIAEFLDPLKRIRVLGKTATGKRDCKNQRAVSEQVAKRQK